MKSAIITGATGFIGATLVNLLIDSGIKVLALGRKQWDEVNKNRLRAHDCLTYCQVDMSQIESLPDRIEKLRWHGEDCVFYNFAWGGKEGLSDLEVAHQMNNVIWSANAMKVAKEVKCTKFVHVGTMEEAFTFKYLQLDHNKNNEYNRHVVYSVAKMGSRHLLKVLSKELEIDLMIGTNSHVMGPDDDKDSFLQVTLQKLIDGDQLIFSTGEQNFDVISSYDCAAAYKLIGEKGKPCQEYWIGSGQARPLKEYVKIMADLYPSGQELQFGKYQYNDISLTIEDFSIANLVKDTGFTPSMSYENTVRQLHDWLLKSSI
jgi:nucleoside-diphosphate-sugar epimerase